MVSREVKFGMLIHNGEYFEVGLLRKFVPEAETVVKKPKYDIEFPLAACFFFHMHGHLVVGVVYNDFLTPCLVPRTAERGMGYARDDHVFAQRPVGQREA